MKNKSEAMLNLLAARSAMSVADMAEQLELPAADLKGAIRSLRANHFIEGTPASYELTRRGKDYQAKRSRLRVRQAEEKNKLTRLESWALKLQAENAEDDAAFDAWCGEGHQAIRSSLRAAWKESRRRTLAQHVPRVMLAQKAADLIRQLDGLQPKQ